VTSPTAGTDIGPPPDPASAWKPFVGLSGPTSLPIAFDGSEPAPVMDYRIGSFSTRWFPIAEMNVADPARLARCRNNVTRHELD